MFIRAECGVTPGEMHKTVTAPVSETEHASIQNPSRTTNLGTGCVKQSGACGLIIMHSSACERCHRRKVRCDKAAPKCSPCVRANVACEYSTSEHQIRRRNIQKLERRIQLLEQENASLSSQLRQNSASCHEDPPSAAPFQERATPLEPLQATPAVGSGNGAVTEQVMHLSLIAGGSDHFVGSASGILLANLLQTCQEPSSATQPRPSWNANPSQGFQSPEVLPARVPKNLARNLIQAYCNHDYLCYPFSSLEKLQQSFDTVYSPTAQSTASDEFIVDIVLAIGTAQVHKYNWSGVYDAEIHYNRAMMKLGDVMAQGGIVRLQALLFVCQYRMGSTSRNTTASVWHLIGVAARMCSEMGLHRAMTYAQPESAHPSPDIQAQRVESMVMKQRCFWSLVALDRVASIALGRPLAIQLEDIDVDLPDTSNSGLLQNYPTPASPLDTPDRLESTAIFIHIVKYRIICGKILNALYRSPKRAQLNNSSFEHSRQELNEELESWHADAAQLPLAELDARGHNSSLKTSSFKSSEWYSLLYHNAILMLYRPSPCLCDASTNSLSLRKIFDSSREAIHLYASLHRSKKLNYSWITMHSVFNAGLSYIYALRNHLQAVQSSAMQSRPSARLNPSPTSSQVVNDTRSCSKVLVAVAERWDAAKDCSDLFDRLSDAVLSDIFEASRIPPPIAHHVETDDSTSTLVRSATAETMSPSLQLPGSYYDVDASTQYAHIQVDDTFRDCFGDLRDMALDEYHNDALSQLSQEWFLGLGDNFLPTG
ncbi:unnamed protein product [Clonostachys rosea]|uniref:Zn(2)-C6 fungal-type domain-containing protein n=1 Tax=Bionectria ochroleuca TaxID=29856 RepID=A0ABY6U234_BIOOC|nr:unnamed protein product [Clonostachys rosea]